MKYKRREKTGVQQLLVSLSAPICGNFRRKSSKDVLRLPDERDVQKPIASRPVSPFRVELAVAMSVSNSSRIVLAIRRMVLPAVVGSTPRLERLKITIPIACSSCPIDLLSVDWRTPNISAACRKLPYSTAEAANRRCRRSIASVLAEYGRLIVLSISIISIALGR